MPTSATSRILVTGAAGSKAAPLHAKGIEAREADDDSASLATAMRGIGRLLLISSSELGVRVWQHRNAIEAARGAGRGRAREIFHPPNRRERASMREERT